MQEADLAPLDFSPTHSRKKFIDFTVDIGTDVILIMTKAPGPLPRPFILFQIFTPIVSGLVYFRARELSSSLYRALRILSIYMKDYANR